MKGSKGNGRRERKQVSVSLDAESNQHLDALSETFRLGPSAVVAMALARWFHSEPLVKEYRNGDRDAGLQNPSR
jgi:hypothetical protein